MVLFIVGEQGTGKTRLAETLEKLAFNLVNVYECETVRDVLAEVPRIRKWVQHSGTLAVVCTLEDPGDLDFDGVPVSVVRALRTR
jgi:broad-specificity NMP kinase